jgi:hypothetical protein
MKIAGLSGLMREWQIAQRENSELQIVQTRHGEDLVAFPQELQGIQSEYLKNRDGLAPRDFGICECCGLPKPLTVHHVYRMNFRYFFGIDPRTIFPKRKQKICWNCHTEHNRNEKSNPYGVYGMIEQKNAKVVQTKEEIHIDSGPYQNFDSKQRMY